MIRIFLLFDPEKKTKVKSSPDTKRLWIINGNYQKKYAIINKNDWF